MADAAKAKAVELVEGGRVMIETTVYESSPAEIKAGRVNGKGELRVFRNEAEWQASYPGVKIKTRAEDGQRYVAKRFWYPYPQGFTADVVTGKPARENMSVAEIGTAIGDWLKQVEALRANGGLVAVVNPDGSKVEGTMPVAHIPTVTEMFIKGFSLSIQGPENASLAKAVLVSQPGSKKTVSRGVAIGKVTALD